MTPTVESLRERLRQLRELHASGALGDEAYAQARAPLERELVDLVVAGGAEATPRPSRRLRAAVAIGVVAVAVVGYAVTGSPEHLGLASRPAAVAVDDPDATQADVDTLIARMAQRLADSPDDVAGWTLLGRAYLATGRFPEAVDALARAVARAGDDASLLADYADALAARHGGRFTPEALQAVERALAIDPGHVKALALAGSAAFDRRDFATAVQQWEKVAAALPADSEMRPRVLESIAQARAEGGLPPRAPAPPAAPTAPGPATPPPSTAAANAGAVSGRVSLAPAVAAQVAPDDTVFILARPAAGARMPLAVLRKQVKDLPASFTLDDSLAMAPGATISGQAQVVVTARVSRSGDAIPQPGDLFGESPPVAPGTQGLAIEISRPVGR